MDEDIDIVTSLRLSSAWIKDVEHESWFGTADMQIEAAAEIERLREELARLRPLVSHDW